MARVAFTPAAREQLRQVYRYIARDSPAAAKAMAKRLRSDAGRLAQFPEMGRVVPEYGASNIRELIVGPYRLIYRYERDADVVRVVAVVHGSRILPRWSDGPDGTTDDPL